MALELGSETAEVVEDADAPSCVDVEGASAARSSITIDEQDNLRGQVTSLSDETLSVRLSMQGDDGHGKTFALQSSAVALPPGGVATVVWDANELVELDVLPATSAVAGKLEVSTLVSRTDGSIVESHGDVAIYFEAVGTGVKLSPEDSRGGLRDEALLGEVVSGLGEGAVLDRFTISPPTASPAYDPALDEGFATGVGPAGKLRLTQQYTQCFQWTVRPTDSSNCTSNGSCVEAEDWGVGATCATNSAWWARNARIQLTRAGGWSYETWADSNGCVTWNDEWPPYPYTATVQTRVQDSDGNLVWLHTVDTAKPRWSGVPNTYWVSSVSGWYPSTTPIVFLGSVNRWSTIAFAGFSLWRHNGDQEGIRYYVGFDTIEDEIAVAYRSDGRDSGTSTPNSVWVSIGRNVNGSPNVSQMKFIVAHELGHGVFTQYADWVPDLQQPNIGDFTNETAPVGPVTTSFAPDSMLCPPGIAYSTGTYEWSALPLYEGFASLYAARVFNDFDEHGCFVWNPVSGSGRERLDLDEDNSNYNSVLETRCCADPTDATALNPTANGTQCRPGHGTNHDWIEMLWNFYTQPMESPNACAGIDLVDMEKLFDAIAWDLTLTTTNAFSVGLDAVEAGQTAGYLPACADDNWLLRGAEWGTDNAQ